MVLRTIREDDAFLKAIEELNAKYGRFEDWWTGWSWMLVRLVGSPRLGEEAEKLTDERGRDFYVIKSVAFDLHGAPPACLILFSFDDNTLYLHAIQGVT